MAWRSTSSPTTSLLFTTTSITAACLALAWAGHWFLGPPEPLKDRLSGPDEAQGEKEKVMNMNVYDEDGWWWSDEDFALGLVNNARIPYFDHVWRRQLKTLEGTFVDVGCGGGTATEALARLGYHIIGVDPSKGAIEQARLHAKEAGIANVEYRVGSAYSLPFEDSSVAGVISSDVLEHLDDLNSALSEIHRVLIPGGIFVFDTINRTRWSWFATILVAQKWLRILPRDVHDWRLYITPVELRKGLLSAGLQPSDASEWIGMRPTLRWPHQGLYRMFIARKGFAGLMDQWKQCGGDLSASYLGWARKPMLQQGE